MKITKIILIFCLLFVFWPTLRIGGLTVFDCLAPFAILFILFFVQKKNKDHIHVSGFGILVLALALFTLSAAISSLISADFSEHFIRVSTLFIALCAMIFLCYFIVIKKLLTITQSLWVLALSATVSSFFCVLQGQFGLFLSLTFRSMLDINEMSRFTGLAEHPIEAGYVAVFGILSLISLIMRSEKKGLLFLCLVINLYSLRYSASLTALGALILSIAILLLYLKLYKIVIAFGFLGFVALSVLLIAAPSSPLSKRILTLHDSGTEYSTLKTREEQLKEAVKRIDLVTFVLGKGYSRQELPRGNIHNGIIASIYHFGLLGLFSQLLFFVFFIRGLAQDGEKEDKALLLAFLLVFTAAYMTGPPFSRRTLWMPVILLSSLLNTAEYKDKKEKRKGNIL